MDRGLILAGGAAGIAAAFNTAYGTGYQEAQAIFTSSSELPVSYPMGGLFHWRGAAPITAFVLVMEISDDQDTYCH